MAKKDLKDVLIDHLRDLLDAERQLLKAIPKLIEGATDDELKTALQDHVGETEGQVGRLERCLEEMGKAARGKHCDAMEGLVKEGDHVLEADVTPSVRDAMIIAAAQKVEHYEISGYGTVCTWAALLDLRTVKRLLGETLDEEKAADEKLGLLAERINGDAMVAHEV